MIKHQNETNSNAEWKSDKSQNQWFLTHLLQINIKMSLLITKRELVLKSPHNAASFFIILLQINHLISTFIHLFPSLVFCFGNKMKIRMGNMTGITVPVPTLVQTLDAILTQSFIHNPPIQDSSGTWISPDPVHLHCHSKRRRNFDQGQGRIVPDDVGSSFCLLVLSRLQAEQHQPESLNLLDTFKDQRILWVCSP